MEIEKAPAQTPPLISGNDGEDADIATTMCDLYRFLHVQDAPELVDELIPRVHANNLDVLTVSDLKPVVQCAVVLAVKDVDNVVKHKPFIQEIMRIHDEAKNDELRNAMKLLLKQPKKDGKDEQGSSVQEQLQDKKFRAERFSALHMAAARGNLEMVKLLVGDAPDVDKYGLLDEKTGGGWTALHLCSNEGHEAVVEFLMDAHIKKGEKRYGGKKLTDWNASDFMMDNRGSTPLHFAVLNYHEQCVEQLLKRDDTGYLTNQRSMDCFLLAPLHIISMRSHHDEKKVRSIADALLTHARNKHGRFGCINTGDCCKFTPLHWAVRNDLAELVRLYLDPDKSRDIDVLAEDVDGKTPLHIAVEKQHTRCEDLLMSNKKVRRELERLHTERQVCVESTNAILIGASLIAGVTFAAYLQPPLGWVTYYNEKPFSAAPPGEFRMYAAVGKDAALKAFWILDCLAFFVSIATVVTSTQTVLRRVGVHLQDDIRRTAKWLQLVSGLFQFSVLCILGAFVAAGIADLPDDFSVRKYTILPTGSLGFALLLMFLIAAIKWGWKFTGNGYGERFFNSVRRLKCWKFTGNGYRRRFICLSKQKMEDLQGRMAAGAESLLKEVRSSVRYRSQSFQSRNADRLKLREQLVGSLQRIAKLDDRIQVMEEVKNIEEKRRAKDPKVNYHLDLSSNECRETAESELQKASKYISIICKRDELDFAQLEEIVQKAVQKAVQNREEDMIRAKSTSAGVGASHASSVENPDLESNLQTSRTTRTLPASVSAAGSSTVVNTP